MITGKETLLFFTFFLGISVVKVPENKEYQPTEEIKKIQEDIQKERDKMLRNALYLSNSNIY